MKKSILISFIVAALLSSNVFAAGGLIRFTGEIVNDPCKFNFTTVADSKAANAKLPFVQQVCQLNAENAVTNKAVVHLAKGLVLEHPELINSQFKAADPAKEYRVNYK